MAFKRGSGTVEVELARLQSWVENADPILYGTDGEDVGLIREHYADRTERLTTERFIRRAVTALTLLGGIPGLIIVLQLLHVLPK